MQYDTYGGLLKYLDKNTPFIMSYNMKLLMCTDIPTDDKFWYWYGIAKHFKDTYINA